MKKILTTLSAIAISCLPLIASAHEHDTFAIGNSTYTFTIGSLNEPVAVDDKTGVDLTVTKGYGTPTPVAGLEGSLKVELLAADAKKTLSLSPAFGKPGSYTATYYPTVATSISYHLIGSIEGNPVDLTFTCAPEGTPKAAEDTSALRISDSVTRISHSGAFGCPTEKETLGFPEQSQSVVALKGSAARTTTPYVIAIVALVFSVIALGRSRRS